MKLRRLGRLKKRKDIHRTKEMLEKQLSRWSLSNSRFVLLNLEISFDVNAQSIDARAHTTFVIFANDLG